MTLANAAHALDLDEIDSGTEDHAANIGRVAFVLHPKQLQ